jgi:hypothetical protein
MNFVMMTVYEQVVMTVYEQVTMMTVYEFRNDNSI